MMDSRILEHRHAQFGGSLGGMVGMGFPYHLGHHHVYDISGHQLQSAAAVPFSIDGLLNGSCSASVANSNPLLGSGCVVNGDSQYKLSDKNTPFSKWRKKENTKKGPGRPAHNSHPTTCSGEPMDPQEIAQRELERLEKKKRKQERRLLKSQNRLLVGELFHTPGSDSDSGVSQSTDSESTPHTGPQPSAHRQQTELICDQHPHHQRAGAVNETAEPMYSVRNSALCPANGITRASTLQKLNPFSVESLLADSSPRRKTILEFSQLPPQRPLVGKGHF
uniref:Homeobox protein unc-4 homolog n=1 Tax=Sinocyclocheilus grahami TaxID=75366 RepID=A0A672KAG8_SINGR